MDRNIKYDFNLEKYDCKANENILNYVICSTPRSGSTLLAKGLQSTMLAGLPHEYFNVEHKKDYLNRWQFKSNIEYIEKLKKNRVTPNGTFGFKLHYNQYEQEFEDRRLEDCFGNLRYIFITRNDKIFQGISLEKADQTNKWSSEFVSNKKAIFNFKNIKKNISIICNQEKKWKDYFTQYNIDPFVIEYEELSSNYEEVIISTLNYLGINIKTKIAPPQIRKQGNLSNLIWKYLYLTINKLKK
ncbi:Stf0 family sulfotransferase [Aestuariivivens insulae]|uniref:Stf0 family sulfotransferase n=1 Tax=Aestuariivivens insulae TaxID=1621988 RepID=UPI001F55CF3C|nr:Stf0 family sulfotransferase [Aestuariivivens insulae]